MKLQVDYLSHNCRPEELPKGTVFVFEGVGMNDRDAWLKTAHGAVKLAGKLVDGGYEIGAFLVNADLRAMRSVRVVSDVTLVLR